MKLQFVLVFFLSVCSNFAMEQSEQKNPLEVRLNAITELNKSGKYKKAANLFHETHLEFEAALACWDVKSHVKEYAKERMRSQLISCMSSPEKYEGMETDAFFNAYKKVSSEDSLHEIEDPSWLASYYLALIQVNPTYNKGLTSFYPKDEWPTLRKKAYSDFKHEKEQRNKK